MMKHDDIRVAILGVGRVGKDVSRLLFARQGFRIVGAHSRNLSLVGSDLRQLVDGPPGPVLEIQSDRASALSQHPDVVVIATTSFLAGVADDIGACVDSGCNVISTAEELAFAWAVDASWASNLDQQAQKRGVTVLGAGANPGFITDALVLTLAGAAWQIDAIKTRRVVRLARFSRTILQRLGIGYTAEEFTEGLAQGRIFGHIGFPASIGIVARSLQVEVADIHKAFEPLVADREYVADNLTIEPGKTGGFIQRAEAVVDGNRWFTAEFIGHVDPQSLGYEPEDQISITGTPDLRLRATPGFDPQFTAAAIIANSLRRVVEARPGLLTVADLPPATPPPTILRVREF